MKTATTQTTTGATTAAIDDLDKHCQCRRRWRSCSPRGILTTTRGYTPRRVDDLRPAAAMAKGHRVAAATYAVKMIPSGDTMINTKTQATVVATFAASAGPCCKEDGHTKAATLAATAAASTTSITVPTTAPAFPGRRGQDLEEILTASTPSQWYPCHPNGINTIEARWRRYCLDSIHRQPFPLLSLSRPADYRRRSSRRFEQPAASSWRRPGAGSSAELHP